VDFSENDVIDLTRDGLTLIEIKREIGASIKVIRRIQQEALHEGYILPAEIKEQAEKHGSLRLTLLAKGGVVPPSSGINWGLANAHVSPNDAYVPIRISHLRAGFFLNHGAVHSSTWDDGKKLSLVAEGTQPLDGKGVYPKQLTSFPDKFVLGVYLRQRIGVPAPTPVSCQDLQNYGRTDIEVKFLENGALEIDFSVS
jgi:hypothetical protein